MARIVLAQELFDDFDRFFDHIAKFDVGAAPARIAQIVDGIQILRGHPMIGRPVKRGMRELIVGSGTRGYVVLYRYALEIDTVFALRARAQREAGYKRRR